LYRSTDRGVNVTAWCGGAFYGLQPRNPTVVNNNNEIIGIVAPNDVLKAIRHHPEYITTITVSEAMTRNIIVVTPEDNVEDLMTIMTKNRIRHLPVIDKGELVGLVSIGDVVKAKSTIQDVEIRYLTDYIEGKYPG